MYAILYDTLKYTCKVRESIFTVVIMKTLNRYLTKYYDIMYIEKKRNG